MTKISIIIPTYNHLEDCLKPCLESIIKYTDLVDTEVIVVANGCTDGTRDYVESLGDKFKLLWIDEPNGYPKSVNEGIINSFGEYLILLNNDTVLLPQEKNSWIDILLKPFETEDNIGITGPSKHPINENFHKRFIIFFCAMIKKTLFDELGMLDESLTPGGGEDFDFCMKAEKAGYKVRQVPEEGEWSYSTEFPINHHAEKTVNDLPGWSEHFMNNVEILRKKYNNELENIYDFCLSYNNDINLHFPTLRKYALKCSHITEMGVRDVFSTYAFLSAKPKKMISYDLFTSPNINRALSIAKENQIDFCFTEKNVLETEIEETDLLFIDTLHNYKQISKELLLHAKKVKKYIIMHDTEMYKSIDEVPNEETGIKQGLEVAIQEFLEENKEWKILEKISYCNGLTVLERERPLVSIIIPTYNHLEDCLKPCLESIIKYTDLENTEVIIVANGCVDGTRDYVESLGDKFKLLWINEPSGYTKSVNEGIKISSGEYLVLLNNDTILLPQEKNSWINILKDPFSDKSVGATGPMMSFCPFAQTDFLIFFCVMIKKESFDRFGLMDEAFNPGFGEDVDFCVRLYQNGYKAIQVPSKGKLSCGDKRMEGGFPIYHDGESTLKELNEKPDVFGTTGADLLFRNRILLMNRFGKGKVKLNLGCGDRPFSGYINVDLYNTSTADIAMDITNLSSFEDNMAQEIISIHAFEHFSPYRVDEILREWLRVLVPGGKLVLELPDILELCRHFEEEDKDGRYRILNCIYGTTLIEHPHLFGWYDEILRDHLRNSGFINITREKPEFDHWGHNMRYECYKSGSPINEVKRNVYDCFPFFNELDILDIRLNELDPYVDKFVLVESTKTHQGKEKPLYFEENKERFSKFSSKIIHITVDSFPEDKEDTDPWVRERYQRDSIELGLKDCSDNDIIIISDVDEIPNGKRIQEYNPQLGILSLTQDLYCYNLNCYGGDWNESKILSYETYRKWQPQGTPLTPCAIRYLQTPKIENGGWHFSYMGGTDKIIEKLEATAHREYNEEKFKNKEQIIELVNENKDILLRDDIDFKLVKIGEREYPNFIKENIEHYVSIGWIRNDMIGNMINEEILKDQNKDVYEEIFVRNDYNVKIEDISDKNVLDIGGNYGFFSLLCYKYGAKKIITYEPEIDNFSILLDNTKKYENIIALNKAVFDNERKSVFIQKNNVGSNVWGNEKENEVECISLEETLKDFPESDNNLILKMDVEGSEHNIIFNSSRETMRRFETIFIEIHGNVNPQKEYTVDLLKKYIEELGYKETAKGAQWGTSYFDEKGNLVKFEPMPVEVYKYKREKNIYSISNSEIEITACVSTKDRYDSTLPMCLMSIANQTFSPKKILIFDDGEQKDLRGHYLYSNIFKCLDQKKIEWQVVFGERRGQVLNHQKSIDMSKTEWIWRIDDDESAEYDVLEKLIKNINPRVGAIGGLVLDPKNDLSFSGKIECNKIKNIKNSPNIQWYKHPTDEIKEVEHLYSSFIYRREASKHGYCLQLSPVGHREESIFTYEMARAGWKLFVNPSAITWHFRNPEGGIRSFKDEEMWKYDEFIFEQKAKIWDVGLDNNKLIVLNNGLGDHCVFKSILPEIKNKYNNLTLGVCYPELFEDDTDIKIISIKDSELLCNGQVEKYNVYKWMAENNHKKTIVDAFKQMYLEGEI